MNPTQEKAQELFADGFNLLPVALDGQKRPASMALPLGQWKTLETNKISPYDIIRWYSSAPYGIGVICGNVSRLLVLDCETAEVWQSILQDATATDLETLELINASTLVQTPSGGFHLYLIMDEPVPRGRKLARRLCGKVLVETRGQGHYVVSPGSPSSVHPLNMPYVSIRYVDHENRATWPVEKVERLLAIAESFNVYIKPESLRSPTMAQATGDGSTPGSLFNQHGSWQEILEPHGWRVAGSRGESLLWTRPGKSHGISATTGHCSTTRSGSLLYVFSTSCPPFESESTYSKFAAKALLEFGGDYSATAKALADQGFKEEEGCTFQVTLPPPVITLPDGSERQRRWKLSSELCPIDPNLQWIIHGILKVGSSTLMSSAPKVGKTTWLFDMLRCIGTGEDFCGLKTRKCRAMIISEEDESTLAERCQEFGIGDHVGWFCRPFINRPTQPIFKSFIAECRQAALEFGALFCVVDTVAKHLPVKDENSASEMEGSLIQLWQLTQQDLGLMSFHHNRKSPGEGGSSARGSGALTGHFEILLNMDRTNEENPTHRTIKGNSRFKQTPTEMLLELTPEGYRNLGEPHEHARQELLARIIAWVTSNPLKTHEDCALALGMPKPLIKSHLLRLVAANVLAANGSGSKFDYHKFYKV
jgi:hypothetical protein